jgi:integrase
MTKRHQLTAKSVENIKAGETRREIPDAGCRGLYLIVQPSGHKSWAARYRFKQETVKLTLGSWPALTLAAARKEAADALHKLAEGRDPAADKAAAKEKENKAAAERAADTVDQWAKRFFEQYARKRLRSNSVRQVEHVLNNIMLKEWSGRTVHDVKRRDVIDLIEAVVDERGPIMANRANAHIRRLFAWLCERDILQSSPCVGVKPPAKEHARDRILSDDEVKRLWLACDAVGGRVGPAVKLLLLTGQRLGEVVGLRRSEISGDVWTLPPERTKNGRRHQVPLARQALAIVNDMPIIAGEEDFVFTSSKTGRLGSFGHLKIALDAHMKLSQPWVLHDCRRSCASGMQRLGVRAEVIERALNHRSGVYRGIAGVYQADPLTNDVRVALQRWSDHVEQVVSGKPTGKVVRLGSRRG